MASLIDAGIVGGLALTGAGMAKGMGVAAGSPLPPEMAFGAGVMVTVTSLGLKFFE